MGGRRFRQRPAWILGTALLFALLVGGYLVLRVNFHTVRAGEIYRSAQPSAGDLREMADDYGIRSVVNLRGPNPDERWYRQEVAASRALGLRHYDVSMRAYELPRIRELLKLVDILETAPRPLLLHCEMGADRSGFASALALILDRSGSLKSALRQFSWRYLVYHDDTVGKQFFERYKAWLKRTGQHHTRERLLYWIRSVYRDSDGNLRFNINRIGDQVWRRGRHYEDGFVFDIDRDRTPDLAVLGWAADDRRGSPVKAVQVMLDGAPLGETEYGLPRQDVADFLGSPDYLHSGWRAEQSLASLQPQCADLSLRIRSADDSEWTSPPEARVCIH
jgi:protein tyrosine phosphatase (PTP) superfamily phosphohydrolase (DUF442 family)